MSFRGVALFFALIFVASSADAQYSSSEPGAGEEYHVEFTLRFWSPTPELSLATGGLTNLGVGPVDFVQDFGIANERFIEYSVISKAGKHKVRYSSIPISYTKDAVITRTLQFGNLVVPVTALVTTELNWKLRRYGYEWDFLSADRAYLGLLADVKDNKLTASLAAIGYGSEDADVHVWVPTIGLGGRGYLHRLFSVTGEFSLELTRFKGFEKLKKDWDGKYVDFDVYGTVNMGRNVALQGGYRSIVVNYTSASDTADLKLKGLYWGANLRF